MARQSTKKRGADVSDDDGIDAILGRLETVVGELESGDLPLERALERFEDGVRLARRGGKLLDAVEERVETLLSDKDEPGDAPDEDGP